MALQNKKLVKNINELADICASFRAQKKTIIMTNGCFDIIHRGHIEVLANTADLGDRLIIGLNTDKSIKKLKGINCPSYLNSSAIDEFLIIFLIAAKSEGISYFKNLSELNKKESPRLKLGSKILNLIGILLVKTVTPKLKNSSLALKG